MRRHSELRRSGRLARRVGVKRRNPKRQAKRRKAYQAALGSARFRKLRLERFALDDWTCVHCGWRDETETGTGLVADHLTYARFGKELITDLRTRCRECDRKRTPMERVNWRRG